MVSNPKPRKTAEQQLEQLLQLQKKLSVKVEAARRKQKEIEAAQIREQREKVIKLVEEAGLFDLPIDQVERLLTGLKSTPTQSV